MRCVVDVIEQLKANGEHVFVCLLWCFWETLFDQRSFQIL